jgi:hypothetical protein
MNSTTTFPGVVGHSDIARMHTSFRWSLALLIYGIVVQVGFTTYSLVHPSGILVLSLGFGSMLIVLLIFSLGWSGTVLLVLGAILSAICWLRLRAARGGQSPRKA